MFLLNDFDFGFVSKSVYIIICVRNPAKPKKYLKIIYSNNIQGFIFY